MAGGRETLSCQVLSWKRERCSGLEAQKGWNGWGMALEEVSGQCDGGKHWGAARARSGGEGFRTGRITVYLWHSSIRTIYLVWGAVIYVSSSSPFFLPPFSLSDVKNTILPLSSTIALAYSGKLDSFKYQCSYVNIFSSWHFSSVSMKQSIICSLN